MKPSQKMRAASMMFGLLIAGSTMAADTPDRSATADRPDDKNTTQINGTVESYNLDRRGSVNGIMLKDGDHVSQLNLPPDQGSAITAAAPIGQKIQATALEERTDGDHAVYRLVSLTADGKQLTISSPDDGAPTHVQGTVKSLNYTPRGDVDGAILDTGDFLQTGPGGAADTHLAIGQKITADGKSRPMTAGHNIISAGTVNGTAISRPPRRPGPPGMGGPGGERGPGGPDGRNDGPPPPPEPGN
jgi:hypothetical protein